MQQKRFIIITLIFIITTQQIFTQFTTNNENICLTKAQIKSSGIESTNLIQFYLNEEIYQIETQQNTNGLNILIIDQQDPINNQKFYNLQYNNDQNCIQKENQLQNIIQNEVQDQQIVLIGVKGDASKCFTKKSLNSLIILGGNLSIQLIQNGGFAMIGKKGAPIGSAPFIIQQNINTDYVFLEGCIQEDQQQCIQYDGICKPQEWYQNCYDRLGKLNMNSIQASSSYIENQLKEHVYKYNIEYQNIHLFDNDCFQQKVKFQNVEQQNVLFTNNSLIQLNIKQSQLNDFGCQYEEKAYSYQWICNLQLEIFWMGVLQTEYKFISKSILQRQQNTDMVPDFTVYDDLTDPLCCQNDLGIETQMDYCEDEQCMIYINPDDIQGFQRLEDIYFQISIVNEEYNYLFLEHFSVKLGPMTIPVQPTEIFQYPGKIVYKIRSNLASGETNLQVILSLSQDEIYRIRLRRNLNKEDLGKQLQQGTPYLIKNEKQIKITYPSDQYVLFDELYENNNKSQQQYQQQNQQKNNNIQNQKLKIKSTNNNLLYVFFIILGLVFILLIITLTVYYLTKTNKNEQNQQQQNQIEDQIPSESNNLKYTNTQQVNSPKIQKSESSPRINQNQQQLHQQVQHMQNIQQEDINNNVEIDIQPDKNIKQTSNIEGCQIEDQIINFSDSSYQYQNMPNQNNFNFCYPQNQNQFTEKCDQYEINPGTLEDNQSVLNMNFSKQSSNQVNNLISQQDDISK